MGLIDRLNLPGRGGAFGLDEALRAIGVPLFDCLPSQVRRLIARRDRHWLIEIDGRQAHLALATGDEREVLGTFDLDETAPLPEPPGSPHQPAPERVLLIPPEAVLTRTVSLPAQVRANLPQVLRYELDRLSPFQAQDVLYDFAARTGPKGAARLSIDLAICRRDLADPWMQRLRDAGSPIDRITWSGAWASANLLPPGERPKRPLARLSLSNLLWLTAGILLVASLIVPLWQRQWIARSLDEEVRRLRVEAVAVDDLRQELERARLGSTAVLQQKWDAPSILVLLRELSDRIPDDTWIQTLDYNSGQVDLRGESAQATALIALLEDAPGIDEVSFRSPVTQVPQTGKERFNISLRFARSTDE